LGISYEVIVEIRASIGSHRRVGNSQMAQRKTKILRVDDIPPTPAPRGRKPQLFVTAMETLARKHNVSLL
jgi:hypothetical protein